MTSRACPPSDPGALGGFQKERVGSAGPPSAPATVSLRQNGGQAEAEVGVRETSSFSQVGLLSPLAFDGVVHRRGAPGVLSRL